jgi:hypothetical protein
MTDLDATLVKAHRGNIERYRRLLRSRLTEVEREFLERRLAEERSALHRLLARNPSLVGLPSSKLGRSVLAAHAPGESRGSQLARAGARTQREHQQCGERAAATP